MNEPARCDICGGDIEPVGRGTPSARLSAFSDWCERHPGIEYDAKSQPFEVAVRLTIERYESALNRIEYWATKEYGEMDDALDRIADIAQSTRRGK